MKDLDQKIIELMDLFDDEQVTTADQIKRPEKALEKQAIDDFMERNPQADGGRIGLKRGNPGGEAEYQRKLKIAQDRFGKTNLDKAAKELGYKNYDALRGEKFANTRRKIFKELEQFGSVVDERESRIRSRGTRIPKEQGIQIKLLEATNKKKFFDPKVFAKENNISLKEVKRNAALLQKNIYNKRMLVAGKDMRSTLTWIPNDPTVSDNALNKLWKSKLIKYEKDKIDELFYQSFGNPKSNTYNPKKFLAIKKNLNEYRQLREAINAKYPNINFELDHPLSKSSLNKLFNATTDQLTRVNVLEADLNNGFKDSLSLQYEKAVQGNNLNKKKAVEKIARDLKLNIGKISDDATNFKYGVKEFQKLNIKDEIVKSLQNLNALNKNFQTYAKNNPDLFKTAGVSTQQTFTKISDKQLKDIGVRLAAIGCQGKAKGSRIEFNLGGSPECITRGLENLRTGNMSPGAKANAKQLVKNPTALQRFAKFAVGPLGIPTEIAIGGFFAATDYATGANKDEIISNLTFGGFGKSMDEQAQERNPLFNAAKNLDKTYSRYLAGLDKQGNPLQRGNPRGMRKITTDKDVFKAMEPFQRVNPQLEEGQMFDLDMFNKALATPQELQEEKTQRALDRGFYTPGDRSIDPFQAAGGGIAKEAGDRSGPPPESGPMSEGLQGLMKRGMKI